MHYCCLMLTKEFPTDEVISKALEPFNEETIYNMDESERVYPAFMWDWWQVGGRYSGRVKLRYDPHDEFGEYKWAFYAKEPRVNRLFRSQALEKIKAMAERAGQWFLFTEEDFFTYMGSRDNFLNVDGAKVADILNFDDVMNSYCFVDADGTGYARETWNGNDFIENDDYDEKVKAVCKVRGDCFAVIIDLHS